MNKLRFGTCSADDSCCDQRILITYHECEINSARIFRYKYSVLYRWFRNIRAELISQLFRNEQYMNDEQESSAEQVPELSLS